MNGNFCGAGCGRDASLVGSKVEFRGGVGKEKLIGRVTVEEGGRYVMPTALCRPGISILAGMKAIVASPGEPPGDIGGM